MKLDNNVVEWLLENNNPVIEYRTKTELLNEKADNKNVIDWLKNTLPTEV